MTKLPKNSKLVFKGKRCEIYQWEQELFDGSKATFENIKRRSSVTIIAVQDGRIVIQNQEQPRKKSFVSMPGGLVDDGEDILTAAKRELFEETGLESSNWHLWKVLGSHGYMDWENHLFIAKNCRVTGKPNLDAGEKIENILVNFENFLLLTEDERFRHKDLLVYLYRMRLYPKEKEKFRKLLSL
ncbi:MAG: NUDIX hydrolase [Candidatus Moranbacteria bacterium]|nr:NUDIX hydrolase [Candidatus Moranbacteria bacterium]